MIHHQRRNNRRGDGPPSTIHADKICKGTKGKTTIPLEHCIHTSQQECEGMYKDASDVQEQLPTSTKRRPERGRW